MANTVSDFFWERLSAWGVKRTFGYPGDGINGLIGALDRARDSSSSFKCGMKKWPRSWHAAMPNLPASSASVSPPRDRVPFTC